MTNRNTNKKWGFKLNPPQYLALGFGLIILIATALLASPYVSQSGRPTDFIDALFTATSATCVTGLVVVDTGTHYNVLGQLLILLLIQIGGLGFMTMGTIVAVLFGKRITFRERLILQEALNQVSVEGIVRLLRKIVLYAFTMELIGTVVFAIRWSADMSPGRALYFGMFHAISFFNNAGFDIFGDYRSITGYVGDPIINIMTMILIIAGGLGFVVIAELFEFRRRRRLSLHTKVVLSTSAILIAVGWVVIFIFEFTNPHTLGPMPLGTKLWASLFQSVTTRTAGANTINIGDMRQATQFFMILLMFIGASPGSTAGGIKTTTFMTIVAAVLSIIRGNDDVVLFRYRISKDRVFRAITITLLSLFLIIAVAMLLSTTEDHHFLMLLFETTSAFGTVGLSMGLTTMLTMFGKIVIICLMFIGRLGPLTLAFALGKKHEKQHFRYPEGKIIIG